MVNLGYKNVLLCHLKDIMFSTSFRILSATEQTGNPISYGMVLAARSSSFCFPFPFSESSIKYEGLSVTGTNGCSIKCPISSNPYSNQLMIPMTGMDSHPKSLTMANGKNPHHMVRNREVCREYDNGTGVCTIFSHPDRASLN